MATDLPTLKAFTGLRNDVSAERFAPGDLAIADNVDLDASGRLARRGGYSLALAGAAHSLYGLGDHALVMRTDPLRPARGALYTLTPDLDLTLLQDDLSPERMAYVTPPGARTYASNHHETMVIEAGRTRSWGLVIPAGLGNAAATSGSLAAGYYQWTLTYLRDDGQESGAPLAVGLDLPAGGGLAFTDLPVSSDPGVIAKSLYLTPANGDQLYFALTLPNATTSATLMNDDLDLQVPLDCQLLSPAPAGHLLAYYRGHLLIAADNLIYYSQPHDYERFNLLDYHLLDSRVTLLAPVDDGIYVATQTRTYFMTGETPSAFRLDKQVASLGAVEGSYVAADPELVGDGQTPGVAALWLASNGGLCLGRNQGQFQNLTGARYRRPVRGVGAGLFRAATQQYLCVLPSST